MRRMNSKNGIIDIVNEAIDEGQIEVGGGLPEIEEGDAGKVLKVNEAEDGVEWSEAGGSESIISDLSTIIKPGYGPSAPNNSAILTTTKPTDLFNADVYQVTNSLFVQTPGYRWKMCSLNNVLAIGSTVAASFGGSYLSAIDNSFLMGDHTRISKGHYVNCLIGSTQTFDATGVRVYDGNSGDNQAVISDSIIWGQGMGCGIVNGSNKRVDYKALIGSGLYWAAANHAVRNKPAVVIGQYNQDASLTDGDNNYLTVGAGTSESARANCFATGNDGTDDYIYIGNTKVTETQLQALLALLNQ